MFSMTSAGLALNHGHQLRHYIKLRTPNCASLCCMRCHEQLRRMIDMRKGIVIMIENQAHSVLEVFELNRLYLLDLLIGDLPLSYKAV